MKRITVASYNIRHGADADLDMNKLASCIAKSGADVVGIQEIDVGTSRVKERDCFLELLFATGFLYGRFVKAIDYKGGKYGTAIISKYPFLSFEEKFLHFEKGCEQRAVGVCKIDADGTVFTFANTHLDLVSDKVRRIQLSEINSLVAKNDNFILTGDFNSENFSIFEEISGANILLDESNKIVTFPNSQKTIDNIVYRGKIKACDCGVITESYSDHNLFWGSFEIGNN